jgi:hypothetical protein
MRWLLALGVCLAQPISIASAATYPWQMSTVPKSRIVDVRASCKQVSTCEEAVELWCSGYRRADADDDGIPCENVCRSKEEVDQIRAQIGC